MKDKSKRITDLSWETVALEGFPVSITEQGFVGLEECSNYDLDKNVKKTKIKKNPKKRKKTETKEQKHIPEKKVKLSNGFFVETCEKAKPSTKNGSDITISNINVDMPSTASSKVKKPKLGEDITNSTSSLTPEDMLSWSEFKLPDEIMKALMELGFKRPTRIQEMALPAALHGRRDILGAAETGSGKTLAFGLPILTGIMNIKEKQESGHDVYEVSYKKSSKKKAPIPESDTKQKGKRNKKAKKQKVKESSEEGYSTGEDEDEDKTPDADEDKTPDAETMDYNDDDYLEEIEVPLKKKVLHSDEESDDDNYIHLSDMLDDDDLADKSSEDGDKSDSGNDDAASVGDQQGDEEVDENAEGIGCVKVIDDVILPAELAPKTGKPLYALILTPTRELAVQITNHLKAVAKYTGIRIATIVGGMAMVKQERQLAAAPEIVVATPGRLWQLYNMGITHLQQLPYVRFLAIDETDRMIERGHFDELHPLLERLNSDDTKRANRQNFVFSATLTIVHDLPTHMKGKKVTKGGKIINRKIEKMTAEQKVKRLVDMIGMSNPKVVDITTQNQGAAETLTESRIACSLADKDVYLFFILRRYPGRTIVFCNSINSVKRLAELLVLLKCSPLPLHASMQQRQRLKNIEKFRDNPHGILVATDVAARGLDIPDVDHVIHYQVPRTAENYIHRSGRTARANKEGLTILMMEPGEAYTYSKLCRTLNRTSEPPPFPTCPHTLPPLRRSVSLARDLLYLQQQKKKATAAQGWREKAAREMDIIVDDDVLPVKEIDPTITRSIESKKRQLDSLLAKPVFPRGFSYKYPTLNDPQVLNVPEQNALEVMKNAIESGEIKKQKRKSKNASFLKLEKQLKSKNK